MLTKGLGLCHGIGGSGMALLSMYRHTRDTLHLHRAMCMASIACAHIDTLLMVPDRPFSLFEGACGLLTLLQQLQHPLHSHFPAYEL